MKNIELFPISRNMYFSGKQLVTRDMEAEQRYFNNKRRLLNTLLHGCGIVCGLGVTAVEEATAPDGSGGVSVAVEPGMAIDGYGREIVVPEQVYLRLSGVEGFPGGDGLEDYAYLCLEYAEHCREPMHSVLDSAVDAEHFNRVEEGYRFFITYTEPRHTPGEEYTDAGAIRREYYGENLEKKLERLRDEALCLAGIRLVRWGAAYSISGVEPAPLGQYVTSALLAERVSEAAARSLEEALRSAGSSREAHAEPLSPPLEMRRGMAWVDISIGMKSGDTAFSADIPHGLGPGTVSMSVGLSSAGGVTYGAAGIFGDNGGYEYAVRTDEGGGTFKIGVKSPGGRSGGRLMFSWMAVRAPGDGPEAATKPYLAISPGVVRLPLRGTAQLACHPGGEGGIVWSVREPEGGSIGPDGFYRAPNDPGVYEINARSTENPQALARAFVVVQEP